MRCFSKARAIFCSAAFSLCCQVMHGPKFAGRMRYLTMLLRYYIFHFQVPQRELMLLFHGFQCRAVALHHLGCRQSRGAAELRSHSDSLLGPRRGPRCPVQPEPLHSACPVRQSVQQLGRMFLEVRQITTPFNMCFANFIVQPCQHALL